MSKSRVLLATAGISALAGAYASAALTVYPGPSYVLTSGGYRQSTSSVAVLPGNSEASAGGVGELIGSATFYNAATSGSNGAGTSTISNAFVVTPSGTTVLNQVPGSTSGYTARTVNPRGTLITGTAAVSGTTSGAVVWTPNDTAYVLPVPTNASSSLVQAATGGNFINDSGTVVGGGTVFSGTTQLGSGGWVYYNTGSTSTPVYGSAGVAQLLPVDMSTATANNQSVQVTGIGPDGTAFGSSSSTHNGTTVTGRFATVWSAGNTAGPATITPTPLTVTPTAALPGIYNTSGGSGASAVSAINGSDVAGGTTSLFASGSNSPLTEPVRWTLASSTVGTVLSVPAGYNGGGGTAINANGDIVGTITASGKQGAAIWKAGTTTPIVLNGVTSPVVDPGTGSSSIAAAMTAGTIAYSVYGVNAAGYSVGYAQQTSTATTPIDAVLWDGSGNATELNSLVPLTTVASGVAGFVSMIGAYSITDDGWISGLGIYYDPADATYNTGNPAPYNNYGAGTYYRTFEIHDSAAVPEPISVGLLVLAAVGTLSRRRLNRAV